MKEVLKFGVIGMDSSVEFFLSAAYQNGMECKAICAKKSAKEVADQFYIETVTSDVDVLLDDELDFIYVASKDYKYVLNCIANGKNVICENELRNKKIIEIAAEYDVLVLDNFFKDITITEEVDYEVEDAVYERCKTIKEAYQDNDFATCVKLISKNLSVSHTVMAF